MKRRRAIIIWIVILITLTISFLLATRFKNSQSSKQSSIEQADTKILKEIETQLNLPYAKPIVSTVYSPSEFTNNGELTSLKKGDKVFVYISSNEAIIYRPSEKKIINILSARALLNTK